jgi:hypothetical protein
LDGGSFIFASIKKDSSFSMTLIKIFSSNFVASLVAISELLDSCNAYINHFSKLFLTKLRLLAQAL